MQKLTINFLIYTIGGIWRPIEWSSNVAKLLYNAFTFLVLVMEYFLMLTQFMDIVFVIDNIDDFVNNSLLFLTIVEVTCKATVIVVCRKSIISLVQLLLKAPYKPQDDDEIAIQTKCDEFIKSCSIKYLLYVMSSVTTILIKSIISVMQGQLPLRIWLPYDINASSIFYIISIQQIMCMFFAGIINSGTDSLIFGLSLQTCAQFEIYKNRLRKLVTSKIASYLKHTPVTANNDKLIMSKCIQHHLCIYKFAKTINIIFNLMLFVQFFGSILILCTSIYYVSTHLTESENSTLIIYCIYTFGMLMQIYILCWCGNEVMLKSMSIGDAIYHMDWHLLATREKKELLIIMMRSTVPIKFTSSFLITLSLQSFGSILKASYSAFNVLQK